MLRGGRTAWCLEWREGTARTIEVAHAVQGVQPMLHRPPLLLSCVKKVATLLDAAVGENAVVVVDLSVAVSLLARCYARSKSNTPPTTLRWCSRTWTECHPAPFGPQETDRTNLERRNRCELPSYSTGDPL